MISLTERAEIFRNVRAVLSRHYVDLALIRVTVTLMSVRLSGILQRQAGTIAPIDDTLGDQILDEIRHLPHMPRLDLMPDDGAAMNLVPKREDRSSLWSRRRRVRRSLSLQSQGAESRTVDLDEEPDGLRLL